MLYLYVKRLGEKEGGKANLNNLQWGVGRIKLDDKTLEP